MPHPFVNMFDSIKVLGAPDSISVRDYDAGSYSTTTGKWVQGTSTDTLVEAIVQPASLKDTEQLPENERTKEVIMVFTKVPLFTSDVTTAEESNIITWQGRDYKVMKIDDWSVQAGYAKHLATRCGV